MRKNAKGIVKARISRSKIPITDISRKTRKYLFRQVRFNRIVPRRGPAHYSNKKIRTLLSERFHRYLTSKSIRTFKNLIRTLIRMSRVKLCHCTADMLNDAITLTRLMFQFRGMKATRLYQSMRHVTANEKCIFHVQNSSYVFTTNILRDLD